MVLTEQIFNLHKATRTKLLGFLEKLTAEQLAEIPDGFHNNVFWNIAHCVATQQILCYKLSGVTPRVPDEFIDAYRKGTAPDGQVPTDEQINSLKKLLVTTQTQLQADYQQGVFKNYKAYMTSYGFELTSIEDAIHFNNTHEGMHLGTVIALNYFLEA